MEVEQNKEFPEIHSERLYEVLITGVEDGETRWPTNSAIEPFVIR